MADPRRSAVPAPTDDLDAAAKVTPEDVHRAQVAAEGDGSPLFQAMLDADPSRGA